MSDRIYRFGEFTLDEADAALSRGGRAVELTPKAFDVLRHLVAHAGRLVTKDELLRELWPETYVTESALTVCIAEARKALGDAARTPRFIETAHRRGYRFIAPIEARDERGAALPAVSPVSAAGGAGRRSAAAGEALIGRDAELARLEVWLERALAGERSVGFVAGEAGIGKTALVEAFLASVEARGVARVARGQCLQAIGVAEAYMPVLEALGRLCREPERERMVALLAQHAPTWLVQMPWLVAEGERPGLARAILGATQERMLREMAQAIEVLTSSVPLVLVLEDMHWSDPATLDLLAVLAQRREPARFLLLATYRPLDAILAAHPLRAVKQTLQARRQCEEVTLDFLPHDVVPSFLCTHFATERAAPALAAIVHRRTDGNPLFMLDVVDHLLVRGALERRDGALELVSAVAEIEPLVPDSLRQMVERQVECLTEHEQRVLELASVAGLEWSADDVGALLDVAPDAVEGACEHLAQRGQLIRSLGVHSSAGGGVTGRFAFLHAFYRDVLYDRIPSLRRVRTHLRLGERLEARAAQGASGRAAELAEHFAQGRDVPRATHYLELAAQEALRRRAPREAVAALDRALGFIAQLPAAGREERELALLEQRGRAWQSMGELAAAAADFARVADAAARRGDLEREMRVLLSGASSLFLIDRRAAAARLDRAAAAGSTDPDSVAAALARGQVAYAALRTRGFAENDFAASERAVARARDGAGAAMLGQQLGRHAYFLVLRSRYAEAAAAAGESSSLALAEGDLFEYLLAEQFRSMALLYAGRYGDAWRASAASKALAERNGHPLWALIFRLYEGWLGLHAGAVDEAAQCIGEIVKSADEAGHRYTADLAPILLGAAETARGDLVAARLLLDGAAERARAARPPVEWSFAPLLHVARAELEIADGEPAAAAAEAARALSIATPPGERLTLLRARRIAAAAAASQRDSRRAAVEIDAGLQLLDGEVPPLAAAELLAAAAELRERQRRRAEAEALRGRGRDFLGLLVASLTEPLAPPGGGAEGNGDREARALGALAERLRSGSLAERLGAL